LPALISNEEGHEQLVNVETIESMAGLLSLPSVLKKSPSDTYKTHNTSKAFIVQWLCADQIDQ
jgi:hypothetical protein